MKISTNICRLILANASMSLLKSKIASRFLVHDRDRSISVSAETETEMNISRDLGRDRDRDSLYKR